MLNQLYEINYQKPPLKLTIGARFLTENCLQNRKKSSTHYCETNRYNYRFAQNEKYH